MQNFISRGEMLTTTVANVSGAAALSAGDGYLVGSIFGVAQNDAAVGGTVVLALLGVFDIAKTTGEAWTQGDLIYWDEATGSLTTTAGSNKLVGTAWQDEVAGATVGRCRLHGASSN